MKGPYYTIVVLMCLALAGCGPTSNNAAAAGPASSPTATPRPGEVNNREALGLGAEFGPICRDCLNKFFPADLGYAAGLKELRDSADGAALIPWFHFRVKGFFAFGNGGPVYVNPDNPQFVQGFSVELKDAEGQAQFDDLLIAPFVHGMQQSLLQYAKDTAEIPGVAVGDKSVGVTSQPTVKGFAWRLDAVAFRLGDVGAFVFALYPAASAPPNDIVKIAQLFADSLKP